MKGETKTKTSKRIALLNLLCADCVIVLYVIGGLV